jgi:hypothetical protein
MLFGSPVFAQKNFEADFGAGFMEGLSTKLKFGNNFQVGICQGFAPGVSPLWFTGAELYGHFGKQSKFTNQHTFYVMSGFSTTLFSLGYDAFEKIMIYPRIGKTVNFSAKSGLNFDVGPGFLSADDIDGYHTSTTFTASIHFFVRF